MKGLIFVVALFAILIPSVQIHAAPVKTIEHRFIIGFLAGTSASERRQIIETLGGTVLRDWPPLNAVAAEVALPNKDAFKGNLRRHPKVSRFENDFETDWLLSDPVAVQMTTLRESFDSRAVARVRQSARREKQSQEVQWGVRRVNAPAAWPSNQGAGVKVAIVDTGIDASHSDLAGNVAGGYNAVNKEESWTDDHNHGTHVAGIVAAALNGQGVVGVAPQARLYAVKVLSADGSGSLTSIIDGMMWCMENGMSVANMSLGAPQGNFFFEYAVNTMVQRGVTLVAAAGNDGGAVNFPAAYDAAVAVSALCPQGITETRLCLTTEEGIAAFSSRGPQVDFIAPGVKIPSTVRQNGIAAYSGTSMATPHVAGLAVLAVAKGSRTPSAIRAALMRAAVPLPGLSAEEQGRGLINAEHLR
ncbi:MAG: S8 family peptidase [Elusimicrobia bacterium]|nr:S8 family peptidase [Elusimicrobiota bacterium]